MSSIITKYQHLLEKVAADKDLSIATPFTRIFTRQKPVVDMGSDKLTIELFKGNRKVAPQVSRYFGGDDIDNNIIRPGVVGANDYIYSLTQQNLELPAGVLNQRIPGEPQYITSVASSNKAKQFRRQWWLMKMSIDATRRIIMRDELLAKQSYFDSEMNIKDTFDGATKLIFPRSSTLKHRTVVASWADAANAKPWTDYGLAQREVKKQAQVDGMNAAISFLSSATMENLKAVYRNQRATEGPDVNKLFYTYDFNPEKDFPTSYEFLTQNGMEYGGWIRSDYSNTKIHLFTLPEGYDSTEDDSAETYTDFIIGETVTLSLDNPEYFKSYFGPGKKEVPEENIYNRILPSIGADLVSPGGLTLGNSGVPSGTMLLNIYQLGQNDGYGSCIEHAPIFAPIRPDVVATIDTETIA